jgi:hypothetical protein
VLRLIRFGDAEPSGPPKQACLVGLDDELADYVARRLHEHWPSLQIQHAAELADARVAQAQFVVCGSEPANAPVLPTLWLSDVERRSHPFRVRGRLWKCATPISGQNLVRAIERIVNESRKPSLAE